MGWHFIQAFVRRQIKFFSLQDNFIKISRKVWTFGILFVNIGRIQNLYNEWLQMQPEIWEDINHEH